jgi:hypothetical protein
MSASITVDQWIDKAGAAFRRARDLEAHLTDLAQVALSQGYTRESASLLLIAARAMPCADQYVEGLCVRFARSEVSP